MCKIAGYAGQKRAAPILIDMLRREQFFDGGLMKPYATVLYETLWAFRKEGRLHITLGERRGHPISKFRID